MTLAITEPVASGGKLRHVADEQCKLQRRVLVVDEHALMRAGLRAVFAGAPWVTACLVADSADMAWQVARRRQPHLVLVSMSLEGRSALELCQALHERTPHIKIVLMSGVGRVPAASASAFGAVGSLSKQMPTESIVASVKRVAEGARVFPKDAAPVARRLSKREHDVLQHLAWGLRNSEVAAMLNMSPHTVKQHISAVYRKLGVRNRAGAATRAQELGLVVGGGRPAILSVGPGVLASAVRQHPG